MSINRFEDMLTGGHSNSLGNTVAVVDVILKDRSKLQDLYDCYFSEDEVVRLRVSSAMKRVCKEQPEWVAEHLDGLTGEITHIDQPSTKWTLSTLYVLLDEHMNTIQKKAAIDTMKHNLETEDDWIVQNTTLESLAYYAKKDAFLRSWLIPQLEKRTSAKHKSVARRAEKLLAQI